MLSHVVNVVMISTSSERWFNAQEEMLALSGKQRHIESCETTTKGEMSLPLCASTYVSQDPQIAFVGRLQIIHQSRQSMDISQTWHEEYAVQYIASAKFIDP